MLPDDEFQLLLEESSNLLEDRIALPQQQQQPQQTQPLQQHQQLQYNPYGQQQQSVLIMNQNQQPQQNQQQFVKITDSNRIKILESVQLPSLVLNPTLGYINAQQQQQMQQPQQQQFLALHQPSPRSRGFQAARKFFFFHTFILFLVLQCIC